MAKVYDVDRERAKDWLASGGLNDPIETLAAAFGELREELNKAHMPRACGGCGKLLYYGECIGIAGSPNGAVYCDFGCAEKAGEPWAEK